MHVCMQTTYIYMQLTIGTHTEIQTTVISIRATQKHFQALSNEKARRDHHTITRFVSPRGHRRRTPTITFSATHHFNRSTDLTLIMLTIIYTTTCCVTLNGFSDEVKLGGETACGELVVKQRVHNQSGAREKGRAFY